MSEPDSTLRVLKSIQETLAGLREDVNARFGEQGEQLAGLDAGLTLFREDVNVRLREHGDRLVGVEAGLAKLHDDITLTNETLGLINSRLGFAERAATVATEGRARLDDRVDRVEDDLRRLEERVDELETDD